MEIDNIQPCEWVLELEDIEKDSARLIKRCSKGDRDIKGVRHRFHQGEILFSKLRTYLNKTLVAIEDGYCTTEIMAFHTYGLLVNEFICHVLRSQYFIDYTVQCGYGVKMPRLSTTDACNSLIPLPPISEQHRIVAEIEKWFTLIDDVEKGQMDLATLIEQTKSKILDLAIRGKLVPQDPADEPAMDLLRRINPSFQPCDTSHYENLPQGWCVCHLVDIADSELGKTLDKEKNTGTFRPYLCAMNVQWNAFDLTSVKEMRLEEEEVQRYSLKKGDLLICEGGEVGRCAIWDSPQAMFYQNALHRVRFKDGLEPHYFLWLLKHYHNIGLITSYSKGMTIKHFTKAALASIPLIVPPAKEQNRIVNKIAQLNLIFDSISQSLAD